MSSSPSSPLTSLPEAVLCRVGSWCDGGTTFTSLQDSCTRLRRTLRGNPVAAALLLLHCTDPRRRCCAALHAYPGGTAAQVVVAKQTLRLLNGERGERDEVVLLALLQFACFQRQPELASLVLRDIPHPLSAAAAAMLTHVLLEGCCMGSSHMVRALLDRFRVHVSGMPLQLAVHSGDVDTVRALLEAGADPAADPWAKVPIPHAALCVAAMDPAKLPILQLLLDFCSPADVCDAATTALKVAVVYDHDTAAELLLHKVDDEGTLGRLALDAAAAGSSAVLTCIIRRHAACRLPVPLADSLEHACYRGRGSCVAVLLRAGAVADTATGLPLWLAVKGFALDCCGTAEGPRLDVVRYLLRAGAVCEPHVMRLAEASGHAGVVELVTLDA